MNQDRGMSRPTRRKSGASPARRPVRLSALALLAPLAACSVGPKFVAPDAPLGLKWRELRSPAIKTSREDYRNWWTAFRDPTLNRLVEIAYDQNLTLMEAGTRVLKARAILGQAIGEVYPQTQQLDGSAPYVQPSRTDSSTNPNNVLAKNFWHVNLGGEVAWEIDLWGKFRHGVESADAVLSRLDRQLRRRPGHPDRRRRQ